MIDIDIPNRGISLRVSDEEIENRRAQEAVRGEKAYTPIDRDRYVSSALKAYAAFTTSAARGAVRDVDQAKN